MFVVPTDDVAVVHAAAALAVGAAERRRNEKLVSLLGVEDPSAWLTEAEAATLAELERRGEATARELAEVVDGLRRKVRVNVGKRYEGDIGISSRVLLQLGLDGKVVRGRPRGSWVSSQYRWATAERWLGGVPAATSEPEARAEVVRRWLARFGPGTEADLRWWTGWPARSVRAALAAADASEVELDGQTGFVLRSDVEPTPPPDPWVALLPALDPTTMGWQARDWYLGAVPAAPVRRERQRRPDRVGRRANRRRLGNAAGRRGGHEAARGRRPRAVTRDRRRGCTAHDPARRDADRAALRVAAPSGARRLRPYS